MLVELMGVSGGGKTTLVHAVLKTTEGARWKAATALRPGLAEVTWPFHLALLREKRARLAQEGLAGSIIDDELSIAHEQLCVEEIVRAVPSTAVISDEGILQMFSGQLLAAS